MDIGNKIKQLRQKCGYTQEQLAGRVGISAQSISKWENAVSMPDITLLPVLAGEFGVSIDELFDLTAEEKKRRIQNRLDKPEELSGEMFREYEAFLLTELEKKKDRYSILSLLAHLYHHRMETDAGRVVRYAEEAIMMCPEKKECQWLLNMARGQRVWDWNVSNHASVIDFYKKVIENDSVEPKTPMPYYYLIDNLLADSRTTEAAAYLEKLETLPACNPILVPIYKAHIALAEHNEEKAEAIIQEGLTVFADNGSYFFEVAQYYAGRAQYEKALAFYEKSWQCEEKNKPRFTDTLEGIATIYGILGNREKLMETYDRMIVNLREEWNYADEDSPILDIETKKRKILEEA